MRQWSDEERKRQSELIRQWQPWKHSTGAKTDEGKEISKMNALKHGVYGADMKMLRRAMKQQFEALEKVRD